MKVWEDEFRDHFNCHGRSACSFWRICAGDWIHGAPRTLALNFWVGIRTTVTLKSSEAWVTGHRAATVPLSCGGIGLISAGAVAVLPPEDVAMFAALAGSVWVLVCFMVASRIAARAIDAGETS